ncbi:DUF2017 family protein [Microbacterium luticocti]|uniref:DUF2017 family protein n=1 Tax=Microbacterium luticocti TaxID=451764 RepID=UPI00048A87BF|nr:DUF2017 family protein [Microbacterium luticocti]
MTAPRTVVLEITALEAAHLADLVRQFRDLLHSSEAMDATTPRDPAVARLVPDAYSDDPEASRQFRDLTAADLLGRRDEDAQAVLAALPDHDAPTTEDEALQTLSIVLAPDRLDAWLRTLTALRLVLASRLGIRSEADHDDDDPRFGIYEWLGYRLEGLVQAADGAR